MGVDFAGVDGVLSVGAAGAEAGGSSLATGVTSTVLADAAVVREAAEERVVRRRGEGEGVAIKEVEAETEAAEGETSLSVRRPVVDDPADGQIGLNRRIRASETGCGTTGCEHPVAFAGADWINSNQFFAFVVAENAQVHVIKPRHAVGADQRSHHLHDFHQVLEPPCAAEPEPALDTGAGAGATAGAGADEEVDDVFGGSGSQWSMMPTMVRSLG